MPDDPSKGVSLSAIRREIARARWERVGPVAAVVPVRAPAPVDPPPVTKRRQTSTNSDEKELRVSEITKDAVTAYNAILAKPNGRLPKVTELGMEKRRADVKRVIRLAQRTCKNLYGDSRITPQFWEQYFGEVNKDDFKAGRQRPGNGHENWTPGFEYLTRPATMLDVIEKAAARA